MPDCPKCPNCKIKGVEAQTYRVAGKPFVKCHDCKIVFHMGSFKKEDFEWRTENKNVA